MDIIGSQLGPNYHQNIKHMDENNIDNIVPWYIRLWLEIQVNGSLNIITKSERKFELGVMFSPARHTQCEVTFRSKIKKSSYHNIREIHKSTTNVNIQYDHFNSDVRSKMHTNCSCKIHVGV